jgi:hypothetical protein
LSQEETEKQGVYVVKRTGWVYPFEPVDAQFLVKGREPAPCKDSEPISSYQAATIADQYYGLRQAKKRSMEERGDCWFTSTTYDPKYMEEQGVYIHKLTGKPCPFYPIDARFYQWERFAEQDHGAHPRVSEEQAELIWCKYFGFNPNEVLSDSANRRFPNGVWVSPKGDYWFVAPCKTKYRAHSMRAPRVLTEYGAYIDQRTGEYTRVMPGEANRSHKKKGKKKGW